MKKNQPYTGVLYTGQEVQTEAKYHVGLKDISASREAFARTTPCFERILKFRWL